MTSTVRGKVWLVGAGPGEPELITMRGAQLLGLADVVLHDALSHPGLLDYCPDAEVRDVGKRYGMPSPPQQWITDQLIELARAGKRVVRLKGGDPFMFARGAEEAEALAAAGVPFEVVPGVSSPVAASAYAGISLTHRDVSSSVTFITGSDREGKKWSAEAWHRLATATDTICVLMGMRRLEEITAALLQGGRAGETPAAIIQWGARSNQRVVTGTLSEIAERGRRAGLTSPAVVIVGEVVRSRETLAWFDSQPLFGKRVLVPRPEHQARETARALRERGAEPIVFPVIEIHAPPDPAALVRSVREAEAYDWIVFTSANGVMRFFEAAEREELDARVVGQAKLACIGPKTAAALGKRGLRADLVAQDYVGESLADSLIDAGARRVLIPRALEAREVLPERLRQHGALVDVVPAYETRPVGAESRARLRQRFLDGDIDVALFTSSSTVTATCEALGEQARAALGRVTVASIGPVTSRTLAEHGVRADVEAEVYTIAGLLDALEAALRQNASHE